jgi:hypothetical protein
MFGDHSQLDVRFLRQHSRNRLRGRLFPAKGAADIGLLSVVWQPNMLSRNVLHRAQIRR